MWKPIKNYQNYLINQNGTVKRIHGKHSLKERILKHLYSSNGYIQVCLCKNGKPKSFWIEYPNSDIIKYESGLEFQRKTGLDHSSISWARRKNYPSYKFKRGKMKGLIVHFEIVE